MKSFFKSILYSLTRLVLKKYHPDIVGVTGSVGKTAAKEAIALVLGAKFKVRVSYKNFNTPLGLVMTVMGVSTAPGSSVMLWLQVCAAALGLLIKTNTEYPEVLVLEMAAGQPGDIVSMLEIAPCTVGVITYIGLSHTEAFKTVKKVAQEKRTIISNLPRDGFAVLNFDSDIVMENASVTNAEKVTYGFKDGADIRATDIKTIRDDEGSSSAITFKANFKGSSIPIFLPHIMSASYIPSALAGLAVGSVFGVNLVDAAANLEKFKPLPGRMNLIRGVKNTFIIDDSYNSSPASAKLAIETLVGTPTKPNAERYAVLGDMLELGAETHNAHRELGFLVAEKGVDFLITVGEASKGLAQSAFEAGLSEHRIASFDNAVQAGKFLQEKLQKNDIVLVKGSRAMHMEIIVKEVMAEPLTARDVFVGFDKV